MCEDEGETIEVMELTLKLSYSGFHLPSAMAGSVEVCPCYYGSSATGIFDNIGAFFLAGFFKRGISNGAKLWRAVKHGRDFFFTNVGF